MQSQREHTLAVETAPAQVGGDLTPHVRSGRSHVQHPIEFLLAAFLLPLLVIELLTAACGVGSDRLDISVRMWADPYFLSRGWDHQVVDALQRCRVVHPSAGRILIGEALSPAQPTYAGAADSTTAKSHV